MIEVVAGRTYRVLDERGKECGRGPADPYAGDDGFRGFRIAGWYVGPAGDIDGTDFPPVEAVDDPESIGAPSETTKDLHAVLLNRSGGSEVLELRKLHALERIADALEALAGAETER